MFFKMKEKLQELRSEVEIPEGIEIEVEGNKLIARKEGKEIRREFPRVILEKKEKKVVVKMSRSTKRERKQVNTIIAHINNIFQGLQEKFVYKLQICSVHFPMNVSIKDKEVVIKNFLGETRERKAKILPEVDVKIDGEIIVVESHDKEAAGQTAATIEKTTTVKGRDRRIYQDGIFITEKAGRAI